MANAATCSIDECSSLISSAGKTFKVITQNIRSINCNMSGMVTLLARSNVDWDLIVLTECWLLSVHNPPIMDGYDYYSTTDNKNQNEGIVVFIKKGINASVKEPSIMDCNSLLITLEKHTMVLSIYRSPSIRNVDNFLESLHNVLYNVASKYKNVILTGDINIDISENALDTRKHNYLNLMASHGMLPAHVIPTHSKSCIDHVILKTKFPASCLVAETSLTDHYSVIISVDMSIPVNQNAKKILKRIDYASLDLVIPKIDFAPLYSMTDVNDAVASFTGSLNTAMESCTKTIIVARRKIILKPWITPGLLKCMKNRDKLHLKTKKSPNNSILKLTYTRYRNFCNGLLGKLKGEYERKEIDKAGNNSKKLWGCDKNNHLHYSFKGSRF